MKGEMSRMAEGKRIPSLDGCRALAISLVLCWHLEFSRLGRFNDIGFDWGTLGVLIFFVISGFLITTLMQREMEQRKSISLTNFYIRRGFRIVPPLAFFLAGVSLLKAFGLASASWRSILFSFSFLRNYRPGPYRILHHLWSLSIEEQFYLAWPLLFASLSRRAARNLLVGVVIICPIIRVIELRLVGSGGPPRWPTESFADGLAWGCLLAMTQGELRKSGLYCRFMKSSWTLALPFIVLAATYSRIPWLYEGVGKSVLFATVAVTLDVVMNRFDSAAGRILNAGPLVAIGKISYSLYLWQQVFLIVRSGTEPYAWFPLNLALAVLLSVISFYLVEQPAVRIGRRIVAVKEYHAKPLPISEPSNV
jgi:peptidoglycan/LPS O-acetylase OafA/YrhL